VGTVFFRNKQIKKELNEKDIVVHSNLNLKVTNKRNNVMFRIRNKSHLKEIIIPIFDRYPFLTNKQYDYIRFKTALLSNITYSKDLLPYTRSNISIYSVEFILNTSYFIP
jgi:ubiquinol-cytochrome c reductase cytochrome b subunit